LSDQGERWRFNVSINVLDLHLYMVVLIIIRSITK
jgi:hypothetical protein